jgi:hypothetical protein
MSHAYDRFEFSVWPCVSLAFFGNLAQHLLLLTTHRLMTAHGLFTSSTTDLVNCPNIMGNALGRADFVYLQSHGREEVFCFGIIHNVS